MIKRLYIEVTPLVRLRSTSWPSVSVFPLVLPRHLDSIPRSLPTFPEPPTTFLTHQAAMTDCAVFRPIVLLSTTVTTYHAVRPFVVVVFSVVVALVARVDLLATAESEPPIGFCIVTTAAALWQLGAGHESQRLLLATTGWSRGKT